jgi:hypothetical protein
MGPIRRVLTWLFSYKHPDPQDRKHVRIAQALASLIFIGLNIYAYSILDEERTKATIFKKKTIEQIDHIYYHIHDAKSPVDSAMVRREFEIFFSVIFTPLEIGVHPTHPTDEFRERFFPTLVHDDSMAYKNTKKEILTFCEEFAIRNGLLKSTSKIVMWIFASWGYVIITYILYRFCQLSVKIGEPVFNIIDVGLFAQLIEFTGGMNSELHFVFAASLLLSAIDFVRRHRLTNDPQPLVQVAAPIMAYFFAILVEYYWAIIDDRSFMEVSDWLFRKIVLGGFIWIIFALLLWMFLDDVFALLDKMGRHIAAKTQIS